MPEKSYVLITGATGGIGAAFARAFAARHHHLILTGRQSARLRTFSAELANAYPITVLPVKADLTREFDLDRLIGVMDEHNIQVLINNAGFSHHERFDRVPFSRWQDMVTLHCTASIRLIHQVLPEMIRQKGGIIINVSSLNALFPMPHTGVYAGSKAMLNALSEALYWELKIHGIQVQVLCPGLTDTKFLKRSNDTTGNAHEARGWMWQTPEDVVAASLAGLRRDRLFCIPGWHNRLLVTLGKMAPRRWYYPLAIRFFQNVMPTEPAE